MQLSDENGKPPGEHQAASGETSNTAILAPDRATVKRNAEPPAVIVSRTDAGKLLARCPEVGNDLLLSDLEHRHGRLWATVEAIEWPDLTVATGRVDLLDVTSKWRFATRLAAKNSLTAELWQDILDETTERVYEDYKAAESDKKPGCHVWQHDDLLAADFPEQRWVVEGLVPEASLVLFGGRKKLGKSWLALQMAQAVAAGAPFLQRPTSQGGVLFLCLEDGERRLNRRLVKQSGIRGLPIHYVTGRFKPLDDGGLSDLRAAIVAHKPILTIVDTLAAIKTGRTDENAAGDMGDIANALRDLAQEHNTAIVVVAHHGKASFGDPGHDLRGSSAVAAAADVNIGLYRTESGHVLKAEGRDLEDLELRVQFDAAHTWCWQLIGDARQLAKREAEAEVLEALETLGEADAATIGRELGKARQTVLPVLKRLALAGTISSRAAKDGRLTRMLYARKEGIPPTYTTPPTTPARPARPAGVDGVDGAGRAGHVPGDLLQRETLDVCSDCGKPTEEWEAGQCETCRAAWLASEAPRGK